MKDRSIKIAVKFTQQQLELLEKLKKEGKYGKTYADIVLNVFREYVQQETNKGGA